MNPLFLPKHGLVLAVGHDHERSRKILHNESSVNGYRDIAKTMSYNTYLHYFLLYNATPPHALVAKSAPFCFPAAPDDNARCDLIQFVTSLTHHAQEPDKILVAFGVNDCESAYVALPTALVVAFTLGCDDLRVRHRTLANLHAAERHINATEDAWNETHFQDWDALMLPDGLINDRRRPRPAPPPFPDFAFRH